MAEHNKLGKKGEHLAVSFLLENGYEILERNYRFRKAEIDIIAKKGEVLAAVEVKTRSTSAFGNPQDFVKPKKIKLMVAAFDHYILKNDLEVEARFDIIAIVKNRLGTRIEHLEDAFLYF
ncbi:MAG TPA: YraN family protein [Flavobacteriaceae bacterium]|nr:YraN family protein [Flavobacteriaceae bacterium]